MNEPRAVLVTGCAGFIGSNFVKRLRERFPDVEIIGIDDFSAGRKEVHPDVIFYEGSILDGALLDTIFEKHAPEFIFHFAALPSVGGSIEKPAKTTDVNLHGTVHLLEKARDHKVKRFIFSSSAAVYGNTLELPTKETSKASPLSPYGLHKHAGEAFLALGSSLYGIDTVSLRYFNVFGPGQHGGSPYATVISAWLTGLYFPNEKELFLEGTGRQSRDFCSVDNVTLANILAMQHPGRFNGDVFNIGHGENIDLLTIKRLIEKHTGRTLNLRELPPRPGDIEHSCADISKAQEILGYRPEVALEEGLIATIEWFKNISSEENA